MKKLIAAAAIAAALIVPAPASADAHSEGCKVVSSTEQTQSRDVTGMTAAATTYGAPYTWNGHTYRKVTRYTWAGVQHRTVTTTVTKCRGDESTSTTATAWASARIIATTTAQRIS